MSQSVVHGNSEEAAFPTPKTPSPERTERRLRQSFAWIILYLLLQAELGLAWDRRWHDYLGRDQFWIPPHMMIYSGIGLAGLLTLCFVLLDTHRYRQHAPGVDDSSTITVLRYFHAPLGFILLGFGALTDLIAAPFDNYWHELYGIDVTLWAPFHLMGTFGGIMVGIGTIYVFASEAVYIRHASYPARRFLGMTTPEWGLLILLASFIELALPALTAFEAFTLGPWQFVSYPLPLALATIFPVAAVQLTRKPGAATAVSLLVSLLSLLTQSYVLYALRFAAAHFGLTFRISAGVPVFNITLVLIPLLFLCSSLLLDSMAYYQQHHQPEQFEKAGLRGAQLFGVLIALLALLVPPSIVLLLTHVAPTIPLPMDVATVLAPNWPATLLTAPFALLIGLFAAWLGTIFGDIWHWNKR
jgi:hypothetical protein